MLHLPSVAARQKAAIWLPSLIGVLYALTGMEGRSASETLTYAAVMALLLPVFGLVLYSVAAHVVAAVTGDKGAANALLDHRVGVAAAMTAVALTWAVGQHWKREEVARIEQCAGSPDAAAVLDETGDAAAVVRWCSETGEDDGDPADDYL